MTLHSASQALSLLPPLPPIDVHVAEASRAVGGEVPDADAAGDELPIGGGEWLAGPIADEDAPEVGAGEPGVPAPDAPAGTGPLEMLVGPGEAEDAPDDAPLCGVDDRPGVAPASSSSKISERPPQERSATQSHTRGRAFGRRVLGPASRASKTITGTRRAQAHTPGWSGQSRRRWGRRLRQGRRMGSREK
jgi:hypothetical protein